LKEKLPDYMIPHNFVSLDAIPLTDTRKVDRRALPDPGTARQELTTPYAPPRTPLEKKLTNIWAEVLSLDEVGIHDNFFELGGHSLTATQIISRVIATFKLQLPIRALFDSPTVAAMSNVIRGHEEKNADEQELEKLLSEVKCLSADELLTTQVQLKKIQEQH
jgi:acyl carrier protein